MKLIEKLAQQAGASVGCSRPVAETLQYLPLDRYVGMSGQKICWKPLYSLWNFQELLQHFKRN